VTTVPNPLATLLKLFAKAFAPLADRDGLGSRSAFVVRDFRSETRRAGPASTLQTPEASTRDGPRGRSAKPFVSRHHAKFADPRWASIRACESNLPTHATREE
jgi:hypothetical protein